MQYKQARPVLFRNSIVIIIAMSLLGILYLYSPLFVPRAFVAAQSGDLEALNNYLLAGGDPNAVHFLPGEFTRGSKSLLFWAARGKAPGATKLLLASPKLSIPTLDPRHPIFESITEDDAESVNIWMKRGISPSDKIFHGTDDHWSWVMSNALIAEKWMAFSAMVDYLDDPIDWNNIVNLAEWRHRSKGRVECLRVLVRRGMPPNILLGTGQSILAVAVAEDDLELLNLLLESGADRHLRDCNNKIPLDYIQSQSHCKTDIERMLAPKRP